MKKNLPFSICLALFLALWCNKSEAQYYQMANTLTNVITPAISGSGSYQGFVEAGYSHTLNPYPGDFVEISTSQGYRYKSWFFMGVGLGADILFARYKESWETDWYPTHPTPDKAYTKKAVMVPLFTDFRFNIGAPPAQGKVSFFLDLKVGCSFLLANKYIEIGDGYLTNREYFFLRPSLGVRIPVSKNHPKQAVNIGVSYKLLTSNYWNGYNNNITLQALGASLGFEW